MEQRVGLLFQNWKQILEALSIALGTLVGGLVGFLVGKIDAQIETMQRAILVLHIFQLDNPLIELLVGDNQYYLICLVYETVLIVFLLFVLFGLLWTVKPDNRPSSFQFLTLLVVFVWFSVSFQTLAYPTISSQNAIDLGNMNVTLSERLEIDSLIVSLDAFRPFVVSYDRGFRLLLSILLSYISSCIWTLPKTRNWTKLPLGLISWLTAVAILFFPFVESRFNYVGTFGMWEGAFNFSRMTLVESILEACVLFISICFLCSLVWKSIRKPHKRVKLDEPVAAFVQKKTKRSST